MLRLMVVSGEDAPGLQNGAPGGYLNGGYAAAVEHDEPIAVSGAKCSGLFGKLCDDVFDDLFGVGCVGLVVGEVHVIAADEPDAED